MIGTVPDSFRRMFETHYPWVVRKIQSLVSDLATAEELAQEVFLRLYRKPPRDLARVRAWLHRVATTTTYDYLRQTAREKALQEKEKWHVVTQTDAAPAVDFIVMNRLEHESVQRVLLKLCDRDREALMLKQMGYSYKEIAEKMNVNPNIIGSILSRALTRFKKVYLSEEGNTVET